MAQFDPVGPGGSPTPDSGARYAFIVGHYKAGSTWLLRLLSLHPAIRGIGETLLFRRVTVAPDLSTCTRQIFSASPWSAGGPRKLIAYRARSMGKRMLSRRRPAYALPACSRPHVLLDFSLRDQMRMRRVVSACDSPEAYCAAFMGYLFDRLKPDAYLVEKTPANIAAVPFIRSVFPKARLISICRDGRDVVVSDRFYSQNRGWPWSLESSAAKWRQSMELERQYESDHGIFRVRYEDMHRQGPETVRQLLEHLELRADGATISHMLRCSSFEFTTGRAVGDEMRGAFNRKGIVGDWKNHFTEDDRRVFKAVAGDALVWMGYENGTNW